MLLLAFFRVLDWPLKKIAGEENEIVHNFLRVMASVVLVALIVVGARMVPRWIEKARHSAADTAFVGAVPEPISPLAPVSEPAADLPEDYTNSIGMQFKLIPAGEFLMGSAADDPDKSSDETPQHRVRITRAFYLGIHEVTQEQFEKVMNRTPSYFKGPSLPVENVSWEDATEFCKKLSELDGKNDYRLPTEAEWEYACRAGTTTRYSCGNELDSDCAWFQDNSDNETHPVGQKLPNGWGLYDMHGNVREWCQDWYGSDYYGESPSDDPTGLSTGSDRANRGGSWRFSVRSCGSAFRSRYKPDHGDSFLGFRCVLDSVESSPLAEETASLNELAPKPPSVSDSSSESPAKLPEDYTNDIGMQFKLIPAGEFMMGSPADDPNTRDNETPRHRVRITKPFYLGIHEVTQAQYEKVMGTNPSQFKGTSRPVDSVSWRESKRFCATLSEMDEAYDYRLPTEAEWEYACRAGTTTPYYCGENLDPGCAWFGSSSHRRTHPVGEKRKNVWGLYDMHGNVHEWCEDWLKSDYYEHSPSDDPPGPLSGSARVHRGGSWYDSARNCWSAVRFGQIKPDGRSSRVGFRVVLVPAESMAVAEGTLPPSGPEPEPVVGSVTSETTVELPEDHTNAIGMQFKLIPAG